jgi:hypothetical protein
MPEFAPRLLLLAGILLPYPTMAEAATPNGGCGEGRHWVKAHFRHAYFKADGTHVRATTVSAHCSDNPPGYAFWIEKLKTGSPEQWPNKKENPRPWTVEQKERVLEALSVFPIQMQRQDIRGIFRMDRSAFFPNSMSGDHRGNIVIYDNAFEEKGNLSQELAHEISHRIFDSLSSDDLEAYRWAAAWFNVSEDPFRPDYQLLRMKVVEPDSANSVEEDFSNNLEYFLFNPTKLQEVSPAVYSWIATRFGDKFRIRKEAH